MRWNANRFLVGSLVVCAGIVGLGMTSTDAAPAAVPDAEFKALVDQDAKNINTLLNDGKPARKTADRSIKSSALMIAAYAQSRMGKNPADDAKLATLRDTAIKVALTGGKKKYAEAVAPAKLLSADIAAGKPDTKPVDLIKATEIDMEELMYQFKKTAVGGLGLEEEIKANAKKLALKPEQISALAQRILVVCDFCDTLQPASGFSATKPKKSWDQYNADMKTSSTALISAAKANNAKDLQAAFTKLDGSCVACHNMFK